MDRATLPGPVLEARQVSVRLGETDILHSVNTTVQPGETVALLGGNGSGKTTLLRATLGLVPRTSGEVLLFGTPVESFRDWHRVGYVPQRADLAVSNATVDELVTTGLISRRRPFRPISRENRTAINEALAAVHLENCSRAQVATLSGGMRHRALIARALAGRPDVILLDEPLAGLDVPNQLSLAAILAQLKAKGLSMLVVLHELGPLEGLIDRSIVLRAGHVIHDGPLLPGPSVLDHSHHHDSGPTRIPLVEGPLGSFAEGTLP